MKNLKLIPIVLFGLLLNSCSGTKVLNSWKAPNVKEFRGNTILVVARTTNKEAREAFENEITNKLLAKGYNATASYTKFPQLRPNDKLNDESKTQIRELLQTEGYNGVVLSVLKDYQERSRTIGEAEHEASVNYGYTDLPTYIGNGFYTYYYHPLSYSTESVDVMDAQIDIVSKLYVLETVAYNLNLPEEKQLVALLTASVENPENAHRAAKDYAKAIAKNIEKNSIVRN